MNPDSVAQHRNFLHQSYQVSLPKSPKSRYDNFQSQKQSQNENKLDLPTSSIMSPIRRTQLREKRERLYNLQQKSLSIDLHEKKNLENDFKQKTLTHLMKKTLKPEDFNKGILDLQIQKKLPPQLDLTSIIHSSPSPVQVQKKALGSTQDRTKSRTEEYASIATEIDNFSLWNVKLDLVNDTGPTYLDKIKLMEETKSSKQNIVSINEQQRKYIHGSSDEDEEYEDNMYIHEQTLKGEDYIPEIIESQTNDETSPKRKDRDYDELMDEFSLHNILFRKGKLLSSTPEFISYQRTYQFMWGSISTVLKMLEKLFIQFDVLLAIVDGKKIAFLAKNEDKKPTVAQLLSCLVNYEDVVNKINIPETKFKGRNGPFLAAVAIQKTWRMYRTRKMYLRLRQQDRHALILQRYWRLKQAYVSSKLDIQNEFDKQLIKWRSCMDRFKKNWPKIKSEERTIIHIPSWSYEEYQRKTTPKINLMQMSQLGRLLDLQDSKVKIILLTPYPMNEEAQDYYFKLLLASGVNNGEGRVKFFYPDNWESLPTSISLTDAILCSPRTIQHIKTLATGHESYIVPEITSHSELRLAVKLQLPILGPDPQRSLVYKTKSGAKRIFMQADVNTAPCEYDLYEEAELFLHLSKRIIDHPEYNTWLIKIDHEYASRGIACLNIDSLHILSEEGRKELIEELEEYNEEEKFTETLRERLYMELRESLGKYVKIISKYAYPDWPSFLSSLLQYGGVIEAVPNEILGLPCANLFIEPTGEIHVQSIQEKLSSPPFVSSGAAFPQVTVPNKAIHDASFAVGKVLYEKGIIGYTTIEYVAWLANDNALIIWGIDLKLHRTDSSLIHNIFEAVTHGSTKSTNGLSEYQSQYHNHKLSYIYSGVMRHEEFSMWRHDEFFNLCKQRSLMYDTQLYKGILFHLLDNLIEGAFGVICIGHDTFDAISLFEKVIQFLINQIQDRKSFSEPISFENSFQSAYQLYHNFQRRKKE